MDVDWTKVIGLYGEISTAQIPVTCTVAIYAVRHGLWLKYCTGIDTEMSCVLRFRRHKTYYSIYKILNKPKILNYNGEKLNSC